MAASSSSRFPPDPDDSLSASDKQRIIAVRDGLDNIAKNTAPELAVEREKALAAWADLNTRAQELRDICAASVVLVKNAGVHLSRSLLSKCAMAAVGTVIVIAEVALAFNGVRFARGQVGEIDSPLDDPLSLIATVGFVVVGMELAFIAARELKQSERSTLDEPAVPTIDRDPTLPEAITDPDGDRLIPTHPLYDTSDSEEKSG